MRVVLGMGRSRRIDTCNDEAMGLWSYGGDASETSG
jgi:hypothetical protein